MGYRIASFNMYKFSFQSDNEIRKDIMKIAGIIRQEAFDIVAMQEVMNPNAMQLLQTALNPMVWGYTWKQPIAHGVRNILERENYSSEGYAFLWNKKRIKLVETDTPKGVRVFDPVIYSDYLSDSRSGQIMLERDPYYGRFTPAGLPGGAYFEFRIINTHIRFSKYSGQNIGATFIRKNEFEVLSKCIFPKISDKRYGNNMPAYTILLGDYNLNLPESGAKSPYVPPVVFYQDGREIKQIVTEQKELSTLKHKQDGTINDLYDVDKSQDDQEKDDQEKDNRGNIPKGIQKELQRFKVYSNNYDHFTYDVKRFEGIGYQIRRVDAVQQYYGGDVEKYRQEISDHVPIVIDIEVNSRRLPNE